MLKRNILSILTAALIMYLSLSSSNNYKDSFFSRIPGFDKIVHILMYFFLMSVIVFENRKQVKAKRNLFLIGLIPLFYGGLMEIFQLLLTKTRSADIIDFTADAAGIFVSVLLCLLLKPVRELLFRS